jgi:hypothetical protein
VSRPKKSTQAKPWHLWYSICFQLGLGLLPFVWWGTRKLWPSIVLFLIYGAFGVFLHWKSLRRSGRPAAGGFLWVSGAFCLFFICVVVFVGAFAKSLHRPERRAATHSASA